MAHPENLLSFRNQGGFMGQGVCWWHSMLTRNANYLAVFRPDLPRVNDLEAEKLIRDLTANNQVVEIPGFKNLQEFSEHYRDLFQTILDQWQVVDGVLFLGWLRGISGEVDIPPDELRQSMDDLYQRVVVQGEVTYQRLQIPGIVAHAWLVIDMLVQDNGYDLVVVDSNYQTPYVMPYRFGQSHIDAYGSAPYTSRNGMEMMGYELAHDKYCRRR